MGLNITLNRCLEIADTEYVARMDGDDISLPTRFEKEVKFLDDGTTYLGTQLESELGGDRCFGVLANMDFILVCTYEKDGVNPELVLYKKR